MSFIRKDYFPLIGEVMGLACFKCLRPYEKYEYLKPNGTISMEYDLDTESYILRVSLDTFLKETIEMQTLEQEPRYLLKNIERFENSENSENSKNSESTNSLESFKSFNMVH